MPQYVNSAIPQGLSHWTRTPYGWDDGYRAAQAAWAASGTPIRVWLHGDSVTAGHAPTNTSTDSFRWLVRNFLTAKFGRNADYFPISLSTSAADLTLGTGAGFVGWNGGTPPWVLPASPVGVLPYGYLIGTARIGYAAGTGPLAVLLPYSGMGGDAAWINPGANAIATFTHQTWLETCQAYDLVAPNQTAGTAYSYNVNGAGANNVTLTADARIQIIQMATGLAAGRVNTVFTGVGATGQPWISGVTAYGTTRGAAGVQVAHLGANAAVLSNFDSNYLSKTLMGVDASSGTVGAGAFPLCPDLVICQFVMSETGLFSPDISCQRLAQYVECLRRSKPNCSIIFVANYRPNGITTDGAAYDQYALGYSTHIESMIAVAEQYGCAFVNVHAAWQGRAVTNGYTVAGEIHPTTAGHLAVAALITPLL